MTNCVHTPKVLYAPANSQKWYYKDDLAWGAWSRCAYNDAAIHGLHHCCGYQVIAHSFSYFGLYVCETRDYTLPARSDNSRYQERVQAGNAFAAMRDLMFCLWGIRLQNWDDPMHYIERAFTPVWDHSLAAYEAAKRALQIEDAFFHRRCVANADDNDCDLIIAQTPTASQPVKKRTRRKKF